MDLNQELFLTINSFATQIEVLDIVMIFVAEYMPYIFIGLLFYLWLSNRKNEALFSGYATTVGIIINQIINIFYFHPRPFMDNLGISLLHHKSENSFPSDHTTFILSISFMLLSFKSTKTLGAFLTIFAIWSGISRIYCGVHYPFDIIGSFVISIFSVIIILAFHSKLQILNKFIFNIWFSLINR